MSGVERLRRPGESEIGVGKPESERPQRSSLIVAVAASWPSIRAHIEIISELHVVLRVDLGAEEEEEEREEREEEEA